VLDTDKEKKGEIEEWRNPLLDVSKEDLLVIKLF